MVVCDGITLMRDIATALESADQTAFVTLSSAGMIERSVHRSMSTGAVPRGGRSSGRKMFASLSLGCGACTRAQADRATASMKRHARPFPLLTRALTDAATRIRNGEEVSNQIVRGASDRATDQAMGYAREDCERIAS